MRLRRPASKLEHMDDAFPGFFHPTGTFWRVNRENVLMLGGGYALLLQLAHPLVAAGVNEHSGFREHPLRRLYSTMRTMQQLTCGDRATAVAAARHINQVHGHVQGTLKDATSVFPKGTPYRADDPSLLLWVHATLVEATPVTYDAFLPPLSPVQRAEYYEESKLLARLLGVPDDVLPRDYPAFRLYFEELIEGPTLEVTPTAARLAEAVLHPPIRLLPGFLEESSEVVTTALLPLVLRERYGLPWDENRQRAWRAMQRFIRRTLSILPDFVRAAPAAKWAERRFRRYRPMAA